MASRVPVHLRLGSAGPDNRAFREAITKMRQDVLEAKAETHRVQDQLNCLIMMVKRAWMGDQAAAIHVANIVGASPPTFFRDEEDQQVNAVNKTRAVHHWAMLSIGLLNRHFKQLEDDAMSQAKERLQRRQDFLDQELTRHKELLSVSGGKGFSSAKRKGDHSNFEAEKAHSAWGSTGNCRPNSEKTCPVANLQSINTNPNHPPKDHVMSTNMIQHLANAANAEKQHDLFSAGGIVQDRNKPKRPTSGNQKLKDNQRARPKSAVICTSKGERPLKYETTRPVSGKPSNSKAHAKSAKGPTRHIFDMTEESNASPPDNAQTLPGKTFMSEQDLSLFDKEHLNGKKRTEIVGHTRYMYKDTVTEGLEQIEKMEEDFRRTAKLLQQKLGISGDGVI